MPAELDAITRAIHALDMAQQQFAFYAAHHADRADAKKAATNERYAVMCDDALARLKDTFPEADHA